MKQLSFGTNAALKAETPTYIKNIYRVLGALSAIWILISPMFPEIPEHTQNIILRILGVGNTIIYAVCQQFGYIDPAENNPE
jgi:hypothetical protein